MLGKHKTPFLRKSNNLLILIFALFAPIFTALAGTAITKPVRMTQPRKASFYMNTDVGIDILNAPTNNQTIGDVTNGFLQNLVLSGRATNTATTASIGFGYLFPVNRWFNLGLRAFAHYTNNYDLYNVDYQIPAIRFLQSSSTLVKLRNWEYGIDLTPSVNIGANQFFTGIFGLAFNRARIDASGASYQNLNTVREFTRKQSVTGARVGFSLEQLLSANFGLYMSYIWTGYGSVNLDERGPNQFHLINSNNFQTHNILVGLKYYFSRQNYQSVRRTIANHFNRFYVSFSVGNLIPQIPVSTFGNFFEQSQNKLSFSTINQGSPVPLGVLGLGGGFLFHHFYLGAEILLNAAERFTTSKIDYEDISRDWLRTTNIRLNAAEGAFDLKLGGVIAPQTLLIGRIGVALNTVHLANLMNSRSTVGVSGVGPQIIQNVSKRVAAPRLGIGIEKLFSGNFSLVANYIYTYYGHIAASASTPVAAQFIQNTVSARVATHAVSIGVNYYFT